MLKIFLRILLKIGSQFLKLIILIILALIFFLTLTYFKTEIYKFPSEKKFIGNQWYNPYEGLDKSFWHKANFQVQSYAWKGITDGSINSNKAIDSIYSLMGYDIIATSDYMKINEYGKEKKSYLKVYEHGYNIFKRHQILIGADKVNWLDFPFFQNIHHKQKIINTLRSDNELIIIAHPDLSKSYNVNDFENLTLYDGIEIHSIFGDALDCWDMALSTGHYVTLQCNDDSHNVHKSDLTGNYCTFINCVEFDDESIINAIKHGRTYGVRLYREPGESFLIKRKRHNQLSKLLLVKIVNDSLFVSIDKGAKKIRFIGQGGKIKKEEFNQQNAFYVFQENDTYIRTEFEFNDSTLMFLNPVVRTNNEKPEPVLLTGMNTIQTWMFRFFILLIEGIIILGFYYILRNFL